MDGGATNPAKGASSKAATRLGVILLLCGEAMFFIALAGAFLVLRSADPIGFAASEQRLSRGLALLCGIGLIAGSGAVTGAGRMGKGLDVAWLGLACVANAGVVAGVAVQLRAIPLRPASDNFIAIYWILAAALAVHELCGILIAARVIARSGRTELPLGDTVAPWTAYWHFATLSGAMIYLLCYRGV